MLSLILTLSTVYSEGTKEESPSGKISIDTVRSYWGHRNIYHDSDGNPLRNRSLKLFFQEKGFDEGVKIMNARTTLLVTGWTAYIAGLGVGIYGSANIQYLLSIYEEVPAQLWAMWGGGIAVMFGGIALIIAGGNKPLEAVRKYNANVRKGKISWDLKLGKDYNGLAVNLRF